MTSITTIEVSVAPIEGFFVAVEVSIATRVVSVALIEGSMVTVEGFSAMIEVSVVAMEVSTGTIAGSFNPPEVAAGMIVVAARGLFGGGSTETKCVFLQADFQLPTH